MEDAHFGCYKLQDHLTSVLIHGSWGEIGQIELLTVIDLRGRVCTQLYPV